MPRWFVSLSFRSEFLIGILLIHTDISQESGTDAQCQPLSATFQPNSEFPASPHLMPMRVSMCFVAAGSEPRSDGRSAQMNFRDELVRLRLVGVVFLEGAGEWCAPHCLGDPSFKQGHD